jgi:hypothetical protein
MKRNIALMHNNYKMFAMQKIIYYFKHLKPSAFYGRSHTSAHAYQRITFSKALKDKDLMAKENPIVLKTDKSYP